MEEAYHGIWKITHWPYVDGTLPIRNNVYVMANGTVSLSVTTADDVLSVLALEDIVRDCTWRNHS